MLKADGRLMISDIVLLKELPDSAKSSIEAYVGCLGGAMMKDNYLAAIKRAGFQEIRVMDEPSFDLDCMLNDPAAKAIIERQNLTSEAASELARSVISIKVYGVKPNRTEG